MTSHSNRMIKAAIEMLELALTYDDAAMVNAAKIMVSEVIKKENGDEREPAR